MGNIIKKKNDFLQDKDNWQYLTWKAVPLLKKYITRFDNIKPRRFSKHSVAAQKRMRKVIIRAKEL